ncbi:unnamed protein product, partial [Prorocentrum cordatum]
VPGAPAPTGRRVPRRPMSWYLGPDGQQIWSRVAPGQRVPRDETVYTIVEGAGALPLENLSYLTSSSKKAVFHECIVDDDLNSGKSNRQREKLKGRQRGFILRADTDESPLGRVVPWFKAAAQHLLDGDVVSRV